APKHDAREVDRARVGAAGAGPRGRAARDSRRRPARAGERPLASVLRSGREASAVVNGLSFLSPEAAQADGFAPHAASPLARALAGSEILDLSLRGKLEVRGAVDEIDVDAEVIPITPERALVVRGPGRAHAPRHRLRGVVVEVTAGLAGIEVEGERLIRRITDLAPDRLPAAGKVADVPAVVTRRDDRFRIYFPQEFGDSVVATVRDAQAGLA